MAKPVATARFSTSRKPHHNMNTLPKRMPVLEYFNAGLELLEDRYVFTVRWRPYDFEAVDPALLDVPCPAPE